MTGLRFFLFFVSVFMLVSHERGGSGLAQSTQQRLFNPQSASPKLPSEKLFFRAEYIWGLLVYPGFSFNSAQFSLGELMGQKKIKMPLHTACPHPDVCQKA